MAKAGTRLAVAMMSTLSAAALAETHPSFSGLWKQDNAKSGFTGASGPQSYVMKIVQQGNDLKVATTITGSRGASTFEHSYTLDGKEQVSHDPDGDEIKTSVHWERKSLVFQTVEKERGAEISTRETWSLSDDQKTLTKNRHSSGPRGEFDRTYVFQKQERTS